MDEAHFQEAKALYDAGEYREAVKGFVAAAGADPEGAGAAYHMAGNALLRLRRHGDAVKVYRQALKDEIYDRRGALYANCAAAHVSLAEYPEAVEAYRLALEEPDYARHYRALQGLGGALFEMGRFADAAAVYRQAALDGDNPDPGRALNNLGLCFMAMDRPADAVEAYKAALGFDTYEGRGKALANLGLAFHALGEWEEAVRSFEKAVELYGHELSEQARETLAADRAALVEGGPERVVVEGWSTGEMPPVISDEPASSPSVTAAGPSDLPGDSEVLSPVAREADDPSSTGELFGDAEMDSEFFTRTEEQMKEHDRATRRLQRDQRRTERNPWIAVGWTVAVLVVLVATAAAAYYSGVGFPTQRMTVSNMLEARAAGDSVDPHWVAVPSTDVDKEMAKLPPMQDFQVEDVERSPKTSRVSVVVTPQDGSPLRYEVTLAREGVGWKVTGVENDWRSTGEDP